MRIDGEWHPCDDGVVRPIVHGQLRRADGVWVPAVFLVDTGADRTVLTRLLRDAIGGEPDGPLAPLAGLGGMVECAMLNTQIRLTTEDGRKIVFRGSFAAAADVETLDICVLGRDLLVLFATIVDYPRQTVCLLSQRHEYAIFTK